MVANEKQVGVDSKSESAVGLREDSVTRCLEFNAPSHAYSAYGLRIHSEIECPELMPHPQQQGNPDVTVSLLPPVSNVSESLENGSYEVRPGAFRMAVASVGQFQVEEGHHIFVAPVVGGSPTEVRLFLLSSAMVALLYQRGLLPLHGSAVETQWGAMVFVGVSGAGKSTLAAQFHRKGYRLLSDDICPVGVMAGMLHVLPAMSHFRLCGDAYEHMGTPEGSRFDLDKFAVPMNGGYCPRSVPLTAIHILADQESGEPQFTVLRGFERVERLLENVFRLRYLMGQRVRSDLMRLACGIAQHATIAQLSRRRNLGTIERLADFLESEWARHFSAIHTVEKN